MKLAAPGTQTATAQLTYGSVERRVHVTADELEVYLRTSTPVIVERALELCPAMSRWSSPEKLAERVGNIDVPLTRLPTGPIRYYRDLPQVMTPFAECARLIFGGDGLSYYVHQANLIEQSPQLREDLPFPLPNVGLAFEEALFWIGSGDTVSRLHCDFPHNFIGQFKGRKRFRIFPHPQAAHLYTPPPYAPDPRHTPVSTMGDTSLSEYPRFADARGLECVVDEGEMLVLPSLWWHQVIAEEPSVMVNWFAQTAEMKRDWLRAPDWATALFHENWELGLTIAAAFEAPHSRDSALASTARLLLERGQPELARRALQAVVDPAYAQEMTGLL